MCLRDECQSCGSRNGVHHFLCQKMEEYEYLKQIESEQNDGCGVCCVKTLIMFLERNMVDEALAVYASEYDKIVSYPEIDEYLEQHIFGEELTKSKVCKVKWMKW